MPSFTIFHIILQVTLSSIVRSRTLMPQGGRVYHKRRSFLTFAAIWMISFSLVSWSTVKRAAADRNALWEHVVKCVDSQDGNKCHCCDNVRYITSNATIKDDHANHGYLVLFDSSAPDAPGLTIPTRKFTGIEANTKTEPLYNYWIHAWEYLNQHNKVGLAINSQPTRDQDQLHIHMSCLNEAVYKQLTDHASQIDDKWNVFQLGPPGEQRNWYAIRVNDIKVSNPFSVLNTNRAVNNNTMKDQNLVVTQSQKPGTGFFILNSPNGSGAAMLYQKLKTPCE